MKTKAKARKQRQVFLARFVEEGRAQWADEKNVKLATATETEDTSSFEWNSNWYATAVASDLDPNRPHAVQLLGRKMVLWKDRHSTSDSTTWRCFLDRCPHRMVPLSEGRIDEAGLLRCSYHGWAFSGNGSCCCIPQAADKGSEQGALQAPRACAATFPVREEQGILFVWPDETSSGASKAAVTPVPLPRGLTDTFRFNTCSRELLYGYEMLAENVMDPSHWPFAHHGVGPLRRSQGRPLPHISVDPESESVRGFSGRLWDPRSGRVGPVEFCAPGLYVQYRTPRPRTGRSKEQGARGEGGGGDLSLADVDAGWPGPLMVSASYFTPVGPGRCRLVFLEGSSQCSLFPLLSWAISARWPGHVLMHQVLDGDAMMLHAQERAVSSCRTSQRHPHQIAAPNSETAGGHCPGEGTMSSWAEIPIQAEVPSQARLPSRAEILSRAGTPSCAETPSPGAAWAGSGAAAVGECTAQPPGTPAGGQEPAGAGKDARHGAGGETAQGDWEPGSPGLAPTSSDLFVSAFQHWQQRYAGGDVAWPQEAGRTTLSPTLLPKRVLLDRYAAHTAGCMHCSLALTRFRTAQRLLYAASVALLLLAASRRGGPRVALCLGALGALVGLGGRALDLVIALFVYARDIPSLVD